MGETGANPSALILEENIDSLYQVLFGVSCAFFALKLLPEPETCDDHWLELRNRMLNGGTHLLGLLIWRVQREEEISRKTGLLQKLESAERQVEELKKRRSEEAKANARVMSIIAAREQRWLSEKKMLRQQIGALVNELRVLEKDMEQSVSELNGRLRESENTLQDKDRSIEEAEKKKKEVEILADELREKATLEAQSHSGEILRHKTALIELVSTQRHLEAELGRALRQGEAARQEVDSVLDQKEQVVLMNQRLSMELVKLQKEVEQKDQILSAMVRKSKSNTAEKDMLLKEVKSCKAMRKQEKRETARWKGGAEGKNDRHLLRNLLYKHVKGHRQPELRKGLEVFSIVSDPYSTKGTDEQYLIADGNMEICANSEVETYRHNLDVEAFVEQLGLKDERLEAFQWSLLSMELESKRLQSYIKGLEHDFAQLRQENNKLEALILDREKELHSLKEQLQLNQVLSNMKVVKRKPGQGRQEIKAAAQEVSNTKVDPILVQEQLKDIVLMIKEGNVTASASGANRFQQRSIDSDNVVFVETSSSQGQEMRNRTNHSMWKMDLHALGVSYRIKRLKQQLLMLERLTGKQECCDNGNEQSATKGFYPLTHLLNKQADRYQSLQAKTDDLCQRIKDDNLNLNSGCSSIARSLDETNRLEHFLDETFQLQRFIVATGQKLTEVQAKIVSGFESEEEKLEKLERFNVKEFADSMRTLFREIQRGLEVRISRIIGDLEEDHCEPNSSPRLCLSKLPCKQKPREHIQMLTPPLHRPLSIPFRWEEAPGKPIHNVEAEAAPSFKNKAARCLDLPPRLLNEGEDSDSTIMPSPETVLDGPYVGRSLSLVCTFSLRKGQFRARDEADWPKKKANDRKFGSNRWESFKDEGKLDGGNIDVSDSPSESFDGERKMKLRRVGRTRSFFNLCRVNYSLMQMYSSMKQTWKRRT